MAAESSATVRLATVPAVRTGASFTAAKVIVTVAVGEDRKRSQAVTVNVLAPFSFAAGT